MNYDEALEIMVQFKLDGKDIGKLYQKVIADKGTRINRERFVVKLASLIKYLGFERNIGIDKTDNGFIKKEDILKNIEVYPRLMVKDVETIKQKCQIVQETLQLDDILMNEVLKNGVYIYSTGVDKLYISVNILKHFYVKSEGNIVVNAGQYLLINNQSKIVIAPKKLYYRLMYMKERYGSTCIERIDFVNCLREQERFETRYEVKDETLEKRYVLPEFNEKKPEEFKQKVSQKINKPNEKEEMNEQNEK